jgi:phosphoribosylformylglycinamidine synthase
MLDKALALGMTEDEYHKVVQILDREPTSTELAMYSVSGANTAAIRVRVHC